MNLFFRNNRVRAFKHKLNDDSDYFPHFPWQLVQLLEKMAGTWSYQSKLEQYPFLLFHSFILFTIFYAVANKMMDFIEANDTEMILECVLTLAFLIIVKFKVICAFLYQNNRRNVYEKVAEQFKTITDPEEAKILKKFADQGLIYTAVFLTVAGATCCMVDGIPVIESYYYYFFVTGELNMRFPLQMKYPFDHQKYWYIITIDFLTFIFSGLLVDFAYDLAFILQIRHIEALFKIVGLRLQRASEIVSARMEDDNATNCDEADDDETANDEAYSLISTAIDLHPECLEMVNMIEDCYNMSWFFILLINTSIFSAGTHMFALRLHNKVETVRNIFAYAMVLMHYQIVFSQGQRIIDGAEEVADFCYDCKWYNLPRKSCKLLMAMMVRTSIPCQITGAQFFILSIESFGKMLKAGVSYYTLFET